MIPAEWEAVDSNINRHPLYRVEISGVAADLALDCDETVHAGRVSPMVMFVRMGATKAARLAKCEGYRVTAVTDEQANTFQALTGIATNVISPIVCNHGGIYRGENCSRCGQYVN